MQSLLSPFRSTGVDWATGAAVNARRGVNNGVGGLGLQGFTNSGAGGGSYTGPGSAAGVRGVWHGWGATGSSSGCGRTTGWGLSISP